MLFSILGLVNFHYVYVFEVKKPEGFFLRPKFVISDFNDINF